MADADIPEMNRDTWTERSEHEMGFWNSWVASEGMKWKEGYQRKTDPNATLAPMVENFLPTIGFAPGAHVKILDIGSGPLSWIGTKSDNYTIDLTAVDPLADQYNAMLDRKGVSGVGRPVKGFFEDALWQLGANQYDIVWSANSLDHSIDPVLGLFNIINVCKIGGGVILMFHPNEAEGEDYNGLHQWNLDVIDGALILHQKGRKFSLMPLIENQSNVSVQRIGNSDKDKAKIVVKFKKTQDANISQAVMR